MIDLSGQTVVITLNPAQGGTTYNPTTGVLTFSDAGGTFCSVIVPPPAQHPDSGWWTCFPRRCDP